MLDLRNPIGYFFLINALLLVGYGLMEPHLVPFGSQQINLNVIWGLVMGSFGALMLALAWRDKHASPDEKDSESTTD